MKIIEGNVTWYSKRDGEGIITDEVGNEYYFDSSVIRTFPEYSDHGSFVLFTPDRKSGVLVASNVFLIDSEHEDILDRFYEENRKLEDFVITIVLRDYLSEQFLKQWYEAKVLTSKKYDDKTYILSIRYTDPHFPFSNLEGYSEMVRVAPSGYVPKRGDSIEAYLEHIPYSSVLNLMFSKVRRI